MRRRISVLFNKYSGTTVRLGFFFLCSLLVTAAILLVLRGTDGMETTWEFTCGMEIMGIVICQIVYYSCMQNHASYGSMTNIFSALLVTCALNLFLDGWSWLVQGIPDRRTENIISNVVLYINTYTMGLMFWLYACNVLGVKTKMIKRATRIYVILYMVAAFICVLNIFLPIYFSIGADGVYRREPYYMFRLFCYIPLVPGVVELIFNTKAPRREVFIVGSFLLLPLLAETLSYFRFGLSTKPAASMLAIILNYVILVANREQNMARTKDELMIGTRIQESILPKGTSKLSGRKNYDIYALTSPAQEVGGDFYDYFMIDDDHMAILVADVSDKGLGAAFYMMISKVLIKSRGEFGGTPADILQYVEGRLSKADGSGMSVTVWLGIIDLSTGHVEVCNAGHDYPAVMKGADGYVIEKTVRGAIVGNGSNEKFLETSFDMKPGDRIFLYTNGLTDAMNQEAVRYGVDRMLEELNSCKEESSEKLVMSMKASVDSFMDGEKLYDDVTMLSFTYL